MYITAGLLVILYNQFGSQGFEGLDVQNVNSTRETTQVDAGILGSYIEHLVAKKNNDRLGLEAGFLLPVTVTGIIYKLYQNCSSIKELFEKSSLYSSMVNTVSEYTTKISEDYFYHELLIKREFQNKFPIATRQLCEAQIGISLQLLNSLTGKKLKPVAIHTIYKKEKKNELIKKYINCPIVYESSKMALVFDKSVLDYPILTANREILPFIENLIKDISVTEKSLSNSVMEYISRNIAIIKVSLKSTAWYFNMSERTLQRKIKDEGNSFNDLLSDVRVELVKILLSKDIPYTEIALLLGYESQSSFNKFFKTHFRCTPSHYYTRQIKQ